MQGQVFKIERYSLHNGPGVRTTLFLKGCPLRCVWCGNPESQRSSGDLMYNPELCLAGCAECVRVCPAAALRREPDGQLKIDRTRCVLCGQCAPACPTQALSQIGWTMQADEALNTLVKDRAFYETSGGGVTLSGGEPLFQPAFTLEVLSRCKQHALHTVLDTCGHGQWADLERILEYTDLIYYDLKFVDPEKHQRYTGVGNELVLSNLARIAARRPADVIARMPCIPGINDSDDDLAALVRCLQAHGLTRVHLLPYHRLGTHKYTMLGRTYALQTLEVPTKASVERVLAFMTDHGIAAQVIR